MDTKPLKDLYRQAHPKATPARMNGFDDAIDLLLDQFVEPAVVNAFGEEVLLRCQEVQSGFREALRAEERLQILNEKLERATVDVDLLDLRGQRALALSQALLRSFRTFLADTAASITYSAPKTQVSDRAKVQAINAVSYIVWAYLGGEGPPALPEEPPEPADA